MDWNYIKDNPLPIDRKKRVIAYYSLTEDISYCKEQFCINDTALQNTYAWTDFIIVPTPKESE